jgi:monofunctional biosynthetic peptidoglycan transglycosylase
MDDRTDNPGGLGSVPETVRTAQPATRLADRIEPVLPAGTATPDAPAGMFSVCPGALADAPPSADVARAADPATVKIEPEFACPHETRGFIPAGAGLTPAGLLGAYQASPPSGSEAVSPAPSPTAAFPAIGRPVQGQVDAAAADNGSSARGRSYADYARLAGKAVALAAIAWAVFMAGLIVLYRFADPPFSALMLQRWLSGESVAKAFVPIDAMAPALVKTVLISEDGRFCEHRGIDLDAIQTALEKAGDGTPRGASTISMQVAKNLFLWPSKSYLRKALEVPLTLAIEVVWPKRRIMEIYLNIAEWGPGVYGAEAAARHHFSKRALDLTERESALLAVALPNPIARDAGKPGAGTRRLAGLIQARANRASRYQMWCVLRTNRTTDRGWQPQVRRDNAP